MTVANLIPHSNAARLERRTEKLRRLLAFLRQEIWTTPAVAGDVMGLRTGCAVAKTLTSFQREGVIVADTVALARPCQVVGITLDGQARVAELLGKPFAGRAYERGRVSTATFAHRVDSQSLRLACARAGWREWSYPDRVPAVAKAVTNTHRPDAIATHPSGLRVAIEVERTIKTAKRYRFIAGRHLDAMAHGEYQRVIYATPDASRAAALQSIWQTLGHVVVAGRDVSVTDDLFMGWRFCTYARVPTLEI